MTLPLKRYWLLLATYLRPQRPRLLVLALLLVGSIALELLSPQIVRIFLNQVQVGGSARDLTLAAVLFLVTAVAAQGVAVAETAMAETVGWTATNRLRAALVAHVLDLDSAFHHARTPGELIERVDGDVTALATFFSRFVLVLVGNALLLIGVLWLLWREDPRIGLAAAFFASAVLVSMLALYRRAQPLWAATAQQGALFYGFLGERIGGTEDVRANGAVGAIMRRFSEQLRGWLPLLMRATLAEQVVWMVALSLFAIATAIALTLAVGLYREGELTIGAVYLVVQYMALLARPVGELQAQIRELQHASVSIGRVEELFAVVPRLAAVSGRSLPDGPLSLQVDHVTFGYGTATSVLDDISFEAPPGSVLGVLGRTGSGKTSIARLLVRLYDPANGTIRLGGVDLREPELDQVRQRVGLVSQEVQVLGASLRDNLALFDPAADDTCLLAALDALGLSPWYAMLPNGLDTQLAAAGRGLSSGEAQLLALARAFLRDPGLIVLDEASARLDPGTERLLEGALDRLLAGRTSIIIAHRLTTVRRADRILVLEAGRIVEQGSPIDLASDPGSRFAAMLRLGLEGDQR